MVYTKVFQRFKGLKVKTYVITYYKMTCNVCFYDMFYLTGVYGSSIYKDKLMTGNEFVYHVFNGSATPIKTHKKAEKELRKIKGVNRAILILRNPFDVLKSEYKRRTVGKTGLFTEAHLSGKYRPEP